MIAITTTTTLTITTTTMRNNLISPQHQADPTTACLHLRLVFLSPSVSSSSVLSSKLSSFISHLHHQTRWRVTIADYPQTETPPPPHHQNYQNHQNHQNHHQNHHKYHLNSFGHNSAPPRINHITTIQELPDSEVVSTTGQVNHTKLAKCFAWCQ